ncbi:BPI/LBP/Plunc family like protein [Aduncisulcus paluster]|nr:BPI/LBP/Plunc family like protein [Aduncisulcus paluster]
MKFISLVLLVFIFSLNFSTVRSDDTSIPTFQKQTVTLDGLSFMLNNFIDIILDQVATMQIPGFSTDLDTPIGQVNISFQNIDIQTIQMDNHTPLYVEGVGIRIDVSQAYIKISLDFNYQLLTFPYTSDGGQLIITANDASFQIEVHVYELNHGQGLSVDQAVLSLGDFGIDIIGSSDVLRVIIQVATPFIQDSIEDAMNTILSTVINDIVNQMLGDVETCVVYHPDTALDLRMTVDPVVMTDYMSSPYSCLYYGTDSELYTSSPASLAFELPNIVNDAHFQLMYKPDVILSMFHTFMGRASFNGYITADDLPTSFPFPFTYDTLEYLFPALPAGLPSTLSSSAPFQVQFSLNTDPTASMQPGAIAIYTQPTLVFSVYDDTSGQWLTDDDCVITISGTAVLMAVPYTVNDSTGGAVSVSFEFDTYSFDISDISPAQSQEDSWNESLVELFLTITMSVSISDPLQSWADSLAYPLQPVPGVLYTDPIIWFSTNADDGEYYAVLITYQWDGNSSWGGVFAPPEECSEEQGSLDSSCATARHIYASSLQRERKRNESHLRISDDPNISIGVDEFSRIVKRLTIEEWVSRQESWRKQKARKYHTLSVNDDDICLS